MERRFFKLAALIVFLVVASVATFWREAYDAVFDLYRGSLTEATDVPHLADSDVSRVKEFLVEREKNNNRHLSKNSLKVTPTSRGVLEVSVEISSSVRGDDYPALRVILYSDKGNPTRVIDYGVMDYQHGNTFHKEIVSFEVTPKGGESSLDVRPFYAD